MIFRLAVAFDALDAERREVVAQPRQRALVQEAGEIVRAVGQQLAAAEADEQIEEFALDLLDGRVACGFRQRDMRNAERVASPRKPASRFSSAASGARTSSAASSAYSCARAAIDLVDVCRLSLASPKRSGRSTFAVDAGRCLNR